VRDFDHAEEHRKFCACDVEHGWSRDTEDKCVVFANAMHVCRRHYNCKGKGEVVIEWLSYNCTKCGLNKWSFENR